MEQQLYSGKAKTLYRLGDGLVRMIFRDEVTAFNGRRRDVAPGKGELAAKLSARLFEVLEEHGIPTHYVCYEGGAAIRVREARVVPLEVTVRNYAYGSLLKRMPLLEKLKPLHTPILEFHYKSDELGDPLVLEQDVLEARLLTYPQLEWVKGLAYRVNDVLTSFWEERGLKLIDFKIEVGWVDGRLVVVDELSGDTMRLMDSEGRHLDKELYRRGGSPSELVEAYRRLVELAGEPTRRCS